MEHSLMSSGEHWTPQQDELLRGCIQNIDSSDYDAIVSMHGTRGSVSEVLAGRTVAALKRRARRLRHNVSEALQPKHDHLTNKPRMRLMADEDQSAPDVQTSYSIAGDETEMASPTVAPDFSKRRGESSMSYCSSCKGMKPAETFLSQYDDKTRLTCLACRKRDAKYQHRSRQSQCSATRSLRKLTRTITTAEGPDGSANILPDPLQGAGLIGEGATGLNPAFQPTTSLSGDSNRLARFTVHGNPWDGLGGMPVVTSNTWTNAYPLAVETNNAAVTPTLQQDVTNAIVHHENERKEPCRPCKQRLSDCIAQHGSLTPSPCLVCVVNGTACYLTDVIVSHSTTTATGAGNTDHLVGAQAGRREESGRWLGGEHLPNQQPVAPRTAHEEADDDVMPLDEKPAIFKVKRELEEEGTTSGTRTSQSSKRAKSNTGTRRIAKNGGWQSAESFVVEDSDDEDILRMKIRASEERNQLQLQGFDERMKLQLKLERLKRKNKQ